MTKFEDAWLAGIFEGEGSLFPTTSGGWTLYVSMTDRDVVDRVHAVAGAGSINFRKREKPHHKDQYAWRCSARKDVEAIVTRMRPFLGERRGARADEFLAWYWGKVDPVASAFDSSTTAKVRAQTAARARAYRARKRAARRTHPPETEAAGEIS